MRTLAIVLIIALAGCAGAVSAGRGIACSGPAGSTIEVSEVLPEEVRVSFREFDARYSGLASLLGLPRGYEVRRVMAKRDADYMMACVLDDCSDGRALFGPSTTFTAVLRDSTRVTSLTMLFFDGPANVNTRVWDTAKCQLVVPCGSLPLARDIRGGALCAIAFPHESVVELDRVARLICNDEGR